MEITNEIRAKMFAQYLGQPILVDKILTDIINGWPDKCNCHILTYIEKRVTTLKSDIRLILTPLSAITDEDAVAVATILGGANHLSDDAKINQVHNLLSSPNIYHKVTNISGIGWLKAFQYLQENGYDMPQHLLSGKTLQEVGLAIYE